MVHILSWFFLASSALAQTPVPDILGGGPTSTPKFNENPFGDIDPSQFDGMYENPQARSSCPDPAECQSLIDLLKESDDALEGLQTDFDFEGFTERSDPFAVVGDTFGTQAYCDPETGDIIQEEEIVESYECFESYEAELTQDVCKVPLDVEIEADYEYDCQEPNDEICVGAYQNRRVYIGSVYVDYGDYDHVERRSSAFVNDVNRNLQDCYSIVSEHEFYEDNHVPVTYICYEAFNGDQSTFHDGFVLEQEHNCLENSGGSGEPPSCSVFEDAEGCSKTGEGCGSDTGNIREAVSCVPDGQSAYGVSCKRERVHELEVLFSYDCKYIYNEISGELEPDPKCNDLLNDESCTRGDPECVENADLQYEEIECQIGESLSYSDDKCVVDRIGHGDQKFRYVGYETFDSASASFVDDVAKQIFDNDDSCREDARECVVTAPVITEDAVCRDGYELVDTSYSCEAPRVVLVDEDYIYGTRRTWDAGRQAHERADNDRPLLVSMESCVNQGERCEVETPPSFEDHTCLQGYRLNVSTETCEVDRKIVVDTDYGYIGKEVYNETVIDARLAGPSDQWTNNLFDNSGWSQDVNGDHIGQTALGTLGGYISQFLEEATYTRTRGPHGGSVVSLLTGQLDTVSRGGGAFSYYFDIDANKAYEYSVYFKVDETDKHRVYFGLNGGVVDWGHQDVANNNPYFSIHYPNASHGYEADVWYKIVGYVLPHGTPAQPFQYGGVYDTRTGLRIKGPARHYRWRADAKQSVVRFFNYYNADRQGQFTHFYNPEVRQINLGALLGDDQSLSYNQFTSHFDRDAVFEAAQAAGCAELDRTCSVAYETQYEALTCQEGYLYDDELVTITRPRVIEYDIDYIYKAFSNYEIGTGFVDTAALDKLQTVQTCTQIDKVCTVEGQGVFSTYTCNKGFVERYEDRNCKVPLLVSTDSDYIYQAEEVWSSNRFRVTNELSTLRNQSHCVRQDRFCATPSPGVFEKYSCDRGYERDYENKTFRRHAKPIFDDDYFYEATRSWNGTKSSALVSLEKDKSCQFKESYCSKVTPKKYEYHSCRQGYQDVTEAMSCDRERIVTVDLDYIYTVDREWNRATKSWTGLEDWNKARSTAASQAKCVKQSESCAQDSPGEFSEHSCQEGYRIDDVAMTCDLTLGFEVETDYVYTGYETWNGSRFVRDATLTQLNSQASSKTCTKQSTVNELALSAAERTSKYSCLSGSITYSTESSCDVSLNVTVTPETKYKVVFINNHPLNSTPDPIPSQCSFIELIHQGTAGGGYGANSHYFNITVRRLWCPSVPPDLVSRGYRSHFDLQEEVTVYNESDSWNIAACSGQTGSYTESCIEGSATRTINGQSVSRSCWKKRRTYGSSETKTVNSCKPPSGFSYKRQKAYTGSPALGASRSLNIKEYEKVESLANATKIVSDYNCLTGYWTNVAGKRASYSCSVPSGAKSISNVCAWHDSGGVCRLWSRSYTVPKAGPPGGYKRHKESWKCDLQVTGSGVASPAKATSFKNWVWWEKDECSAVINSYSNGCTHVSSGYYGPATTKTVDGHSITRQFRYKRNYTCHQRKNINTCSNLLAANDNADAKIQLASFKSPKPSQEVIKVADLKSVNMIPSFEVSSRDIVPEKAIAKSGIGETRPPPYIQYAAVGDWTYQGRTCINYEGSTCTLWKKDYRREEVDGSGGCHRQQETYLCENAVSKMGTAKISRHVDKDYWQWPSPDCQKKLAQYDSCVYKNQSADTSTGGVRKINGLNVNRSSWQLDRNYSCTNRIETNTCNPPSGAKVAEVKCVWKDSSNVCRLSDYKYQRLLPDPTNGCTTHTDKFLCEEANHGRNYLGTYRHFDRLTYPRTAENEAALDNAQCARKSWSYGGGQFPKVIDGIEVTPVGSQQWYIDEEFRCHEDTNINTCNVPKNSTFVFKECLSTIDGGACSLYRDHYSVELPDPSGGCLRWTEEFLCENKVSTLEPVGVPVEESGSERDLSACGILENEIGRVKNSAAGSVHRFDLSQPVASSWIEVENTNGQYLHLGEIRIWGRNSAGVIREITAVHRDELVATQGSTYAPAYPASNAVDGNTHTINHTLTDNALIRIGFPEGYQLTRIDLLNRDNYDNGRLKGAVVRYEKNERLCERTQEVCVQGAATRKINGASIYKDCWEWRYDYSCTQRDDYDTCEPEASAVLDDETCLSSDEFGNCTYVQQTYLNEEHDPSGGCDQYEHTYDCADKVSGLDYVDTDVVISKEYWDRAPLDEMSAQYENCKYVTGSYEKGPLETRDYKELKGLSRSWDAQWTYDCYNRTAIDSCASMPEGSSLLSTECADEYRDSCVLQEHTYSVPIENYANGCAEYSTKFKCENALSDEFAIYTEFKSIESEGYDLSACNSMTSGFESCRLESSVCSEGEETRNVDGLDVSRSCWQFSREYECDTREIFDTCTIPRTAVNIEENCVWRDRTNNCRLFENTYQIELPDPTGGCTTFIEEFRCEDTLQGPDLVNTVLHVEEDYFDYSGCEREDDGSVCTFENSCIEGAGVRNIDGLEVNRNCWKQKRENSCQRRDNYDECGSYVQYGPPSSECAWTDAQGVCRLFTNTYAIPVDDGSGGCHSWESSYWCNSDIAEIEHEEHIITVTSTSFDNDSCASLDSQDNAHRTGTVCLDSSNGPRAPPVVRNRIGGKEFPVYANTVIGEVDADCWQEERLYTIEAASPVNSCTGAINRNCELQSNTCGQYSRISGECSLDNLSYSCGIEGSDYCEVQENVFSCVGPATASSSQLNNLNGNLSGYEPKDITANVIRTYWDNNACTQATSFGNCSVTETVCSDGGNLNSPRQVERAQDDYFQQFVGYAPKQSHECWEETRTFDCGLPEELNYCGDTIEGCEFASTNCLYEDPATGVCSIDVNSYSCDTGQPGTCSQSTADYVCDDPVEGHTPNGTTSEEVSSEYDLSACVEENQDEGVYCEAPESVCTQPAETRYFYEDGPDNWVQVDGQRMAEIRDGAPLIREVPVEADCWEYENTYDCTEVGEQVSDCEPAENCEATGSTCLSYDINGVCTTTEYDYDCTTIEETVLQEGTPGTCEAGETAREAQNPPNTSTGPLAALLGVAQADRETGQGQGFTIFEGTHRTCKRDVLGVKNCCSDSGVLLNLGLGKCSDSEIQLAVQKEENRCVDVGSYCSKKVFPGICTRKRRSYCCYEAEIGKIIAEAGRAQLNRPYGDAKDPDCGGFTVEEFQQLDLDEVDFSAVSGDIMGSLSNQSLSQYENAAENAVSNLLNGGGQ